MAGFCRQCSLQIFLEDFEDFTNICAQDETAGVLCEECGLIYVDQYGQCLSTDDHEHAEPLISE